MVYVYCRYIFFFKKTTQDNEHNIPYNKLSYRYRVDCYFAYYTSQAGVDPKNSSRKNFEAEIRDMFYYLL